MPSSDGEVAKSEGIILAIINGYALVGLDVDVEESRKEDVATDTLFTRLGIITFSFSFRALSVSASFASERLASERLALRLTALFKDLD